MDNYYVPYFFIYIISEVSKEISFSFGKDSYKTKDSGPVIIDP